MKYPAHAFNSRASQNSGSNEMDVLWLPIVNDFFVSSLNFTLSNLNKFCYNF